MIEIEKIKKEIVANLKPIDPQKIILFGSFAYGTPNEDSDLDICIIKNSQKRKIEEKREIRNLLASIDMPKDILLIDEKYYLSHSDANWINTALYDVRHRGEVLYEKK